MPRSGLIHNWANAIAMATPIAHKGVTAGPKVQAIPILDLVSDLEQLGITYPTVRAGGSQ